jgi:predicted Zn-dependent protease
LQGEKNGVKELIGAGVYGLHGWALLEQKLGNWSKARDLLERAANIQPGNAVIHQTRALLESRAHNYAAARYHFKLAVDSAPKDVKCWQVSIAHIVLVVGALFTGHSILMWCSWWSP